MPVSAGPTTSMIGQSELSVFKKVIYGKKMASRFFQNNLCFFFPDGKHQISMPNQGIESPLLVPEMVATASAEKTPSAPPLGCTEGAAEATALEGTERPRPLVSFEVSGPSSEENLTPDLVC